ncbi:hypothetical protein [Sulfurihydrogenibium azorense]|jgi:hypothetical protein|nr:hypothetical protein [Sulfurihydrogenibium azorense]MDM7273254.1 hypothetical protein [Sulfurihydrogenibium azorense]
MEILVLASLLGYFLGGVAILLIPIFFVLYIVFAFIYAFIKALKD